MKIVMMTDLEGVSGVVSFIDQGYATGKYHERAKKLLTAEVNAAIEGMLDEDVDDVLVIDGHGPGGIYFEDLHPAAKLCHGRPVSDRIQRGEILKTYNAAIMIGQHAMAGTELGNLNHTQSSETVEYYKLNGQLIGEIAQWALHCGALELPMIFLSGDEAACQEVQLLIPGITTAAVKQGLSRTYAISCSPAEAHRRIREGVKIAIQKQRQKPITPFKLPGPYVLEKRFFFTHIADAVQTNPMYQRIDERTVRLKSDDILDIIYG
ncbi:M55 family metallopeptidase [candidate division KSB1 bacterium]|nr:M55 family metallopeptidase [candidate division KSB1 bacterium]